jgi:hypothetical protein
MPGAGGLLLVPAPLPAEPVLQKPPEGPPPEDKKEQ